MLGGDLSKSAKSGEFGTVGRLKERQNESNKDNTDDFMLICGNIGHVKSLFTPNRNLQGE